MDQTRLSVPKSRINLAAEDKEMRLYRRYWEGEYKSSFHSPDSKKKLFRLLYFDSNIFFRGCFVFFFWIFVIRITSLILLDGF